MPPGRHAFQLGDREVVRSSPGPSFRQHQSNGLAARAARSVGFGSACAVELERHVADDEADLATRPVTPRADKRDGAAAASATNERRTAAIVSLLTNEHPRRIHHARIRRQQTEQSPARTRMPPPSAEADVLGGRPVARNLNG
mgnify:CR=1 FL=1